MSKEPLFVRNREKFETESSQDRKSPLYIPSRKK